MTNLETRVDRLTGAYFSALIENNFDRAKAIAQSLYRLEMDRAGERFLSRVEEVATYDKLYQDWPVNLDGPYTGNDEPPVAAVALKKARAPRVKKTTS